MQSYKRIAGLINDAKLAGLLDWSAIEDRTRSFIDRGHWNDPQEIIRASARSYHEDLWDNQHYRVFVIIEKEALVGGTLENLCWRYDIPLLAARGIHQALFYMILYRIILTQLDIVMDKKLLFCIWVIMTQIGIDMTRDLSERIQLFNNDTYVQINRLALNMPQIDELNPPRKSS